VAFPTVAELLSEQGIVSGLAAVSSILGVIALSFWAIAAATDYSTGLIRLLAAANPRRWQLLFGKWLALALLTAATTVVALIAALITAPVAAQAAGFAPDAWGTNLPSILLTAAANLFAALLVWGTLGLALATFTRSAGIAIGVGVGYVLLLESVIKAAVASIADWLPGTTISALAAGGTAAVSYQTAIGLAVAYIGTAIVAALLVYTRRDITD
jgi:ABC-2 type transport system permease protein